MDLKKTDFLVAGIVIGMIVCASIFLFLYNESMGNAAFQECNRTLFECMDRIDDYNQRIGIGNLIISNMTTEGQID